MGQKGSKTAPEHVQQVGDEDRHSSWGSDIDEAWCGPGTLCADEWTPMQSLAGSPESHRRKMSDFRIEDDVIITEQPGLSEEDNVTNFDVMTIHDPEDFQVPTILVTPVTVKPRRKKKKRRKLVRRPRTRGIGRRMNVKKSRKPLNAETPIIRRAHPTGHLRHHRPRHHMIYVRRIRVHQDPRYPRIPPPQNNPSVKFRRSHTEDVENRFSKAVPPRHLKGQPVSARPHFRYRGIPKVIG